MKNLLIKTEIIRVYKNNYKLYTSRRGEGRMKKYFKKKSLFYIPLSYFPL
jgi:hypothetical protein